MEDTLSILKSIKKHIERRGGTATADVLNIAIKVCEAMSACYYEQIAIAAFEEDEKC